MKNFLLIFILTAVSSLAIAQNCRNTTITPSFNSECILTKYPTPRDTIGPAAELIKEENECNVVCKNSLVTYSIYVNPGDLVSWTVIGANSFSEPALGVVDVQWGNSDEGSVSVTIISSNGNIYTETLCVVLIEPPNISSTTIPAGTAAGGITICQGESVIFTNTSTVSSGEKPIVGHVWEIFYQNNFFDRVANENYTLTPTNAGTYTVTHTVINSCGCESSETYTVTVKEGIGLGISCYGTVCAGSTHTYYIKNPNICGSANNPSIYTWTVTNGLINGSTTATGTSVTIQWGNPQEGYGIITITGSGCPDNVCATYTVKIPIISSNALIFGPDTLCVGETQIYNTTLWGSTEYKWTIEHNGSIYIPTYHELQNGMLYTFNNVGTYDIKLDYYNYFLKCGGNSHKKVIVLPRLEIKAPNPTICAGTSVTFTTNPPTPATAAPTWYIYDSINQAIYPPSGTIQPALTYTFNNPGKYRITAYNHNFCNTATYIITVKAPPPPYNGTISGPDTVCSGSSATYRAIPPPTNPNYILLWQLAPPCSQNMYSGDSVSINFGNTICNILVYQQDMVTGCMSNSIVYPVSELFLAQLDTTTITVCAGGTFVVSAPAQQGVLYEWTISPTEAASVVGNNHSPTVTIIANNSNNTNATISIKREYCNKVPVIEFIKLNINNIIAPTIPYDSVCKNETATIWAYGGVPNGTYYWDFLDGTYYNGNPALHTFYTAGQHHFTLQYTAPNGCTASVLGSIFVHELPMATVTYNPNNNTMNVTHQINTTYQWYIDGNIINDSTNYSIQATPDEEYCCIVTDTITHCTNQGCYKITTTPPGCLPLTLSKNMIACNKYEITITNPQGLQNIQWTMTPALSENSIIPSPSNPTTATATFGTAGFFVVWAKGWIDSQCYEDTIVIRVDYVPRLELAFFCPDSLYVFDYSFYRAGFNIPQRTINVSCGTQSQIISGTQNIATFNLPPVNTPTLCTISMTIGNCTVTQNFTYYPLPSNLAMNIENISCENTPILFTASANNASSFLWNFGDGSSNNNNPVYHTFDQGTYYITLTAYNANGCNTNITQQKTIYPNNINGFLDTLGSKVCVGQPRPIMWDIQTNIISYDWSTPPLQTFPPINTHLVYQSGDYLVTVTSNRGCIKESMINVPFYNLPTAKIIGATCYCQGDSIILNAYKNPENAGSNITYTWSAVIGGQQITFNGLKFSQIASVTGTYTIYLTVKNEHSCEAKDSIEITVLPKPNPPSLIFAGNECIHKPPVCLTSVSGDNLYWSNGYFGDTACFYNAGFVTAYYKNPITGCSSDDANKFICPAPNFDALLTGCYDTCQKYMPLKLPFYLLIPFISQCNKAKYNWYFQNAIGNHLVQSGYLLPMNSNNPNNNILDINDFGNYYMEVFYGNNCTLTSPILTINKSPVEICDKPPIPFCDSVKIENCYINCCQIYFDKLIRVCNKTNRTITYTQLTGSNGYTVVSWSPNPLILAPGQCEDIFMTVRADSIINQTTAIFTLSTNEDYNCEPPCDFVFSITPNLDCIQNIKICDFQNYSLTYNAAASTPLQNYYFDFNLVLPPGTQNLISLWTTPTVVVNYNYQLPNIVSGNIMITHAQLMAMIAAGERICFNAIVCRSDAAGSTIFCKATICVPIPIPPTCNDVVIEDCYVHCGLTYFNMIQRVCNRTNKTITYTHLTASQGYTVISWLPNPLILMPGQCATIRITVRVDNINQTGGQLTLFADETGDCNGSHPCNLIFPININCKPNPVDCKFGDRTIYFVVEGSTMASYNFNFNINLPAGTQSITNFVVVPYFPANYTYFPPNHVSGIVTIPSAALLEMVTDNKIICFSIEVRLIDGSICSEKICFSAKELYEKVPENFRP